MQYAYYVGIGIAIVIIGTFLIFQFEPKQTEQNNPMPPTVKSQIPIAENLARTLAESHPLVKAVLMIGGYHYDGIFYSGNQNGTFVNVVYQSNNGTSGPLVVTEDRNSTRIISVEFQPYRHYG